MKRIEDGKEVEKDSSCCRLEAQGSEYPCQSEKNHDSSNADGIPCSATSDTLLYPLFQPPGGVPNDDADDNSKYHHVEDDNDKDWAKKSPKEHSNTSDEAATCNMSK